MAHLRSPVYVLLRRKTCWHSQDIAGVQIMEVDLCQTSSPQSRRALISQFFSLQKRCSWKIYLNTLLNINPFHRERERYLLCTYSFIPSTKIYGLSIMNSMECLLLEIHSQIEKINMKLMNNHTCNWIRIKNFVEHEAPMRE